MGMPSGRGYEGNGNMRNPSWGAKREPVGAFGGLRIAACKIEEGEIMVQLKNMDLRHSLVPETLVSGSTEI